MTVDMHRKFFIYSIMHVANAFRQFLYAIPTSLGLDVFKAIFIVQLYVKNSMLLMYDRKYFIF